MNDAEATPLLLQWHYLIFLLPFGVAAFLLLLTSLRPGHGHHGGGHHAGGGHYDGHYDGHHGSGMHHAGGAHSAGDGHHEGCAVESHGPHHSNGTKSADARHDSGVTPLGIILSLIGAKNAPLPMVLEIYALSWGIIGYWANRSLVPETPTPPTLWRALPAIVIAFVISLIAGRLAAALIGKLMPRDESYVVSRDSLFGLTGRIVFAASETSGRIHVYDEFGTLHDESCRVEPGMPGLAKGETARIVDRNANGHLIVENAPSSPISAA